MWRDIYDTDCNVIFLNYLLQIINCNKTIIVKIFLISFEDAVVFVSNWIIANFKTGGLAQVKKQFEMFSKLRSFDHSYLIQKGNDIYWFLYALAVTLCGLISLAALKSQINITIANWTYSVPTYIHRWSYNCLTCWVPGRAIFHFKWESLSVL